LLRGKLLYFNFWHIASICFRDRKGSALPSVLMATIILSLLGTGFLSLAALELRSSENDEKISKASYLAEAGINLARAYLRKDPNWKGNTGTIILPEVEGRVSGVKLDSNVVSYRLTSTGEVDKIKRVLEVDIARPFYSYALACKGDLTIKNTFDINGDLFASGDIELRQGAAGNVVAGGNLNSRQTVKGSVIAGGSLYNYGTIEGDVTVDRYTDINGRDPNVYGYVKGNITKGLNISLPRWQETETAVYKTGSFLGPGEYGISAIEHEVNNPAGAGEIKVLYCDGTLTIVNEKPGNGQDHDGKGGESCYRGKAVIAAAGDIYLKNDLRAGSEFDAWAFIAEGDIIMDGGITVDAVLICNGCFYKQGAESIINGCLVTGGIEKIEENGGGSNNGEKIGGKGSIRGKLSINYDKSRIELLSSELAVSGWQLLSWREASIY